MLLTFFITMAYSWKLASTDHRTHCAARLAVYECAVIRYWGFGAWLGVVSTPALLLLSGARKFEEALTARVRVNWTARVYSQANLLPKQHL